MKTEELKALGLSDEQITAVHRLNGLDIENYKTEVESLKQEKSTLESEKETLQEQVNNANQQIEDFKDMDIESIKQSAEDYKNKFEQSESKRKEELEKLQLDHQLETSFLKAGAKNVKAVKALIDMDMLKESKNLNDDIKAQIDNLKESDSYLFEAESKPTGNSIGGSNPLPSSTEKMTYDEMLNAYKKGQL